MLNIDILDFKSILFKGKSLLDNSWVYGYYINDNNKSYILKDLNNKVEILPNTLSMFSGLSDINNKKIFTGDVIYNDKYNHKHLIIYFNGAFRAMNFNDYENIYNINISELNSVGILNQDWIKKYEKYILGNIYDMPDIFIKE